MKRIIAAAFVAALTIAAPAAAAPDRTGSVSLTERVFKYEGVAALGTNVSFFHAALGPAACTKDPNTYCDTTLVHVNDEYLGNKRLNVLMDGFEASDFDLRVYRSNANGDRGDYDGNPAGQGTGGGQVLETFAGDHESKDVSSVKAGSYILIDIVYFATVPAETPNVTVTLK